MTGTLLNKLASLCAELTYDKFTPEMTHKVKRVVLDAIGCALGAWRIGVNRDFIPFVCGFGGPEEATIWGDGSKVPAPFAAFAIGSISTHLEFDSYLNMIPAAFSVAEKERSSGKDLITALMVAFNIHAAVKHLFASEIESHGLHWPAQLAAYPAAAAACKLNDASPDQIAGALSLAGCLAPVAPYEAFTKGSGVKDIYGGWGSMLGILAANLSSIGVTGPETIFEGKLGIGQAWRHSELSSEDFGQTIDVMNSSPIAKVSFKAFPTNTCAHAALTAIEILRAQHPELNIDNIERIEVGTYTYGYTLSTESSATDPISAKANIPYLCAVLLVKGVVLPEHTEEPHIRDSQLRDLASKVSVFELPDTDTSERVRLRPASVVIFTKNGKRLEAKVSEPRWRVDPASDADLEKKFDLLIGNLMTSSRRDELRNMIWHLESVTDIGEIVSYLV